MNIKYLSWFQCTYTVYMGMSFHAGNEGARIASIVLFCISGVSGIIAVVAAVVAIILFWKGSKKKKTEELKMSA